MADSKRICSVDGCGNTGRLIGGVCERHYARFRKHGSYDRRHKPTVFDWLVDHAEYQSDECLIWPFAIGKGGYGNLAYKGKYYNAHRLMCEIAHGPAPDGMEAAHSCHNPTCVSPRHLRWKTRSENSFEKADNGTQHRGEATPNACLTAEIVREIRQEWPLKTCDELAEKYGCKRNTVWKAATGRTWAHVE